MSSCACTGPDAALAWTATQSSLVRTVTGDVHFGLQVSACSRCGQQFAVVFEERVIYDGGGDDQTWKVVAISNDEAEQLTADGAAKLFDGRRTLVRVTGVGAWWK